MIKVVRSRHDLGDLEAGLRQVLQSVGWRIAHICKDDEEGVLLFSDTHVEDRAVLLVLVL